ncbi:MAG: PaaI family thioesterase [Gammaproteobacteria bacterium]|nr:PaaI family thioesterase [Gammaproteobacteria bacterium]
MEKTVNEQLQIDPFSSEEITPAISAEWEAKRRVASALRELNELLVSSNPPITDLHALAAALEVNVASLASHPRVLGRAAFVKDGNHGNFRQLAHELNPLSGISNPLAPPMNIWLENGLAHGRVTTGWAYEGPPESLHGGYVAAIFDQFMGLAQALGGQPGMTGTLAIRYLQRTPLNTELVLKGWVEKVEGRKTSVRAEMRANNMLTATCDGIFVQPLGGMGSLARPAAKADH